MTLTARLAALSTACLTVACASLAPEIRLQTTAGDLALLVGKWSGEYQADDSRRRHGTILFELVAGDDHAHGNVVMTPPRWDLSDDHPPSTGQDRPVPPVLTIRFVFSRIGFVEGALDPYWDAEKEAQVWTTFHGEIKGDRIEGWYVSRASTSLVLATGTWRVSRVRERGGKTLPIEASYRGGPGTAGSLTIAVVPPSGGHSNSMLPR